MPRITLLTISIGVPDRDAYVAGHGAWDRYLLDCQPFSEQPLQQGGGYVIGKILSLALNPLFLICSLSRSATFWGMKTTSPSLPLLGSLMITFRSLISLGVMFKDSLILIPHRPWVLVTDLPGYRRGMSRTGIPHYLLSITGILHIEKKREEMPHFVIFCLTNRFLPYY